MPRPTINTVSQAELVVELKRWADTARHAPKGSAIEVDGINHIVELIQSNPDSALRSHVLHNIGCQRRRWLRQLSTILPPSLALERDVLWRMGCGA